jgi:hypothetical protein
MMPFNNMIDQIPNNVCIYIIQHSNDFSWNFLALKIMLTRLNLKIIMHHGQDGVLQQCCVELKDLLRKSKNIPNAQKDANRIFSLQEASLQP